MSISAKPGPLLAATLVTLALQFPAVAADLPTEDKIATSEGDLVIHPIHHAAMWFAWNKKTILIDPAPRPGGTDADVTAEYAELPPPDLILITHEHGDHFNVAILEAVAGSGTPIVAPQSVFDKMPDDLQTKTLVLRNGDSTTLDGVGIQAVPAYNITKDRLKYHPQGRDNGYVLAFGATRVYVAGDTEDTPEMRALTNIDAAFLPMNLPYTMTVEQAADAVKAFKPTIVYPYHYGDSDVEKFKELVGSAADVRLLKWY